MIGRPLIILPYDKPGCVDRLVAFLRVWLVRLGLILLGFVIGYGCDVLK